MKRITFFLLIACTAFFTQNIYAQCEIFDLVVDFDPCDDGKRDFFVDLEHINASDSFELRGNGRNYGTFAYVDLPVILQDIEPPCGVTMEMVAIDQLDPNCKDDFDLGADLCCECEIFDIEFDILPCDANGNFSLVIDFEHEGTSQSFTLSGNGQNYGTFRYDNLPITLGPLEGDCITNYGFLIKDRENPDCLEDFGVGTVCCNKGCDIRDIEVEIVECNGDSCYELIVDFIHENTGSSFSVSDRGGLIGVYSYRQLPLTIDCYPISGRNFEFIKICDMDSLACCEEFEFEAENCESDCIRDFIVEAFDCDSNNNFWIEYDFIHENVGDSGYCILVNGMPLDTLQYDSFKLALGPIQGGCDSTFTFRVIDKEFPSCNDSFKLEKICCDLRPCELGDIKVEALKCDSNKMFYVVIDFEHVRTSDSFNLYTKTGVMRYAYTSLPITVGPFEGDCTTRYNFLVEDEGGNCERDKAIGPVCCEDECNIRELVVEASECDTNKVFSVDIDFDYEFTSDSFVVKGNGQTYGKFAYSDLPITIDGLEADCDTEFEFVIQDCEKNDCAADFELGKKCCEEECMITELEADAIECNGDSCFVLKLNFNHKGTSGVGFDVFDRNGRVGFYRYTQLPLTIDCFPISGKDFEFIQVCDNDNPDCCAEIEIEALDCAEECKISELIVEDSECDTNDLFTVDIDFDFESTSDSFTIRGNGNNYGKFTYADLPITLDSLEGDCDTEYEFVIIDCANEDCREDFSLGKKCCEKEPCEFGELKFDRGICDTSSMFTLFINFDYARNSDSFCIEYNNQRYTHAYTDLPLNLGLFEGDCMTTYYFLVWDKEANCEIDGTFGPVCCDECNIRELIVEASECDTNNLFSVDIDFEYESTSDSFTIRGNGNNYGKFAYADLPITLDSLDGNCDTEYEFVIIDCEDEDCRASFDLGKKCCEECMITDLEAKAIECNGDSCFVLQLDFEHKNTGGVGFDVFDRNGRIGFYRYEQLPLTIDCFPISGKDFEFIKVCDNDNPDCCAEIEIEALDCSEECMITELEADAIECNGDSCFVLKLNFNHKNTGGVGFDVFDRNGRVGFYRYDQLPLTIDCFPISGKDFEFIKVCDNDNPDCCAEIEIEALDCDEECMITDLKAEAVECNGDSCFVLKLDFNHKGTGGVGFDVFDRNGRVGFYKYDQLPLTIDCFPISGRDFEFIKVCDNDNPDCCAEIEIEALDCDGVYTVDIMDLGWNVYHAMDQDRLMFIPLSSATEVITYNIFNSTGVLIESNSARGMHQIDVANWTSGVHVIQVIQDGKIGLLKWVKP